MVKTINAPVGFKLMTNRFVVKAISHCTMLLGNIWERKKYEIILDFPCKPHKQLPPILETLHPKHGDSLKMLPFSFTLKMNAELIFGTQNDNLIEFGPRIFLSEVLVTHCFWGACNTLKYCVMSHFVQRLDCKTLIHVAMITLFLLYSYYPHR